MTKIFLSDYWRGYNESHPMDLTPAIKSEAYRMVDLANKLLDAAEQHGVELVPVPGSQSHVKSGWRPPSVNKTIANAAPNSKHMIGKAIDIYDPEGDLDEWLLTSYGRAALEAIGLWVEHPSATKSWCHLQSIPPKSGNRFFYP